MGTGCDRKRKGGRADGRDTGSAVKLNTVVLFLGTFTSLPTIKATLLPTALPEYKCLCRISFWNALV